MGGKNAGADEAKKARKAEEKRQARIREGTARINSIFDGQTVGDGALGADAAFDPNGAYYLADGTRWTPTTSNSRSGFLGTIAGAGKSGGTPVNGKQFLKGLQPGGGKGGPGDLFHTLGDAFGGGGRGETAEEQFRKLQAEGKLYSGTKNSGGFGDDFYSGRRQAYMDYATPQLEDQYGKAQKELVFSLDRSGNLDSTARAEKMSELQRLYDIQKQQVADKALSFENQARNSVEDARANLISMLNVTGDAEGAASAALARSEALTAPTEYSPLSQLFVDFTNGLGVQAAQERSYAAGGPTPRYNTGLFGNAGRVTVS